MRDTMYNVDDGHIEALGQPGAISLALNNQTQIADALAELSYQH